MWQLSYSIIVNVGDASNCLPPQQEGLQDLLGGRLSLCYDGHVQQLLPHLQTKLVPKEINDRSSSIAGIGETNNGMDSSEFVLFALQHG